MGLLDSLFETRAHPGVITDQQLNSWWNNGPNAEWTGATVTETSATQLTAVYCAVKIIAETFVTVAPHLYRRIDQGRERVHDHPVSVLLNHQANSEQTAAEFREWAAFGAALKGTAYAEIEFDNNFFPRALWPLPYSRITPKRVGGKLWYFYRPADDREEIPLADWQVLKLPGFSMNGITGLNIVDHFREVIGQAQAVEEHGARFFGNGARPGAILESPSALSEQAQENLRQWFEKRHKGLSNAHRLAILEEGIQYKETGFTNEQSQFIQSKNFNILEFARIWRIPPHMLMDLTNAHFSNLEQSALEFVQQTMMPWFVRFEQRYQMQLLTPSERSDLFIKHNVNSLLRGDTSSRKEFYTAALQWGWMSRNEVRALEDQNAVEGLDNFMVPANMLAIDESGTPQLPESPTPMRSDSQVEKRSAGWEKRTATQRQALMHSFAPVFRQAAAEIIAREKADIMREVEKQLPRRNLAQLKEFIRAFYEKHPEFVRAKMAAPVQALMRAVHENVAAGELSADVSPEQVEQFANEYLDSLALRHVAGQRGQVEHLINENPLSDLDTALATRFEEWGERSPEKIAARETIKAGNAVTLFTYTLAGVTLYRWVTIGENCPYCESMNGRQVAMGGSFFEGGSSLEIDGQAPMNIRNTTKHPPLHSKCNCQIIAG